MKRTILIVALCAFATSAFAQTIPPSDREIQDGVQACLENVLPTGIPLSTATRKWTGDWTHCPVLIDELAARRATHDTAVNLKRSQDIAKRLLDSKK